MEELLKNAKQIYTFSSEGEQYYSATYLDSNKEPKKKILDKNFDEVKVTDKIHSDEMYGERELLNNHQLREFKKQLKNKFKIEETQQKNTKKIEEEDTDEINEIINNKNIDNKIVRYIDQFGKLNFIFKYKYEGTESYYKLNERYEDDHHYDFEDEEKFKNDEYNRQMDLKKIYDNSKDSISKNDFIDIIKESENISRKTDKIPVNAAKLPIAEQNEILEKNGIKENQIYKFKTTVTKKDDDNKTFKEESIAYYQIKKDKEGLLRLFNYVGDTNFKNQTNFFQDANAENLHTGKAIAILDKDFTNRMLAAKYKQNHAQENVSWKDIDCESEFTNITELVQKENKKRTKDLFESKKEKHEDVKIQKFLIKKIPDDIVEYYKKGFKDKHGNIKPRPMNPEIYTEKMFKMISDLYDIPDEDRNINSNNNIHRKTISPFMKAFDNTDCSEEARRKTFNKILYDKQTDEEFMACLGNLYHLTHQSDYKGLQKKRKPQINEDRNSYLDALKKNNLPFMQNNIIPDYIYNPATNTIYRGSNQMRLQIANKNNPVSSTAWAKMDSVIKNCATSLEKSKVCAEYINIGPDKNGHMQMAMVIPVKPNHWDVKHQKRMQKYEQQTIKNYAKAEKARVKEEYRRNIHDAKYLKKYGTLPVYMTNLPLIPEIQPAISKDIKNTYEYPGKESTLQDRIKYDMAQYTKCMLTKENYISATDWTNPRTKKELENFIKHEPELFHNFMNETYENIATQARTNSNVIQNVNQNINENTNKKHKGRTA